MTRPSPSTAAATKDADADADPMAEVRADIDRIDRSLVALLAERAGCIDRAIAVKSGVGLPARIDSRVEEVVTKVRATATAASLDPALVEDLWRRLIEWSIVREEAVLRAAPARRQD